MRSTGAFTPTSSSTRSSAFRRRSPSMPHFWKVAEYLSSLYFSRKSRTVCRGCCTTPPSSLRRNSTCKHTRSEITGSNLIDIAQHPAGQRWLRQYCVNETRLTTQIIAGTMTTQGIYHAHKFFPACHLVRTKKTMY